VPVAGDWVKVYLPRLGVEYEGIVVQVGLMYGGFQAAVANNIIGSHNVYRISG
jgi:hypothetical protein